MVLRNGVFGGVAHIRIGKCGGSAQASLPQDRRRAKSRFRLVCRIREFNAPTTGSQMTEPTPS
jgi:hypothetical protein